MRTTLSLEDDLARAAKAAAAADGRTLTSLVDDAFPGLRWRHPLDG